MCTVAKFLSQIYAADYERIFWRTWWWEADWCGMCFSLILLVKKKNLLWGTEKKNRKKEGNGSSKSNPPHTKCWCSVRGHCEQPLCCCCDHLISEVNPLKNKSSLNSSTFCNGCCAVCLSSHIRYCIWTCVDFTYRSCPEPKHEWYFRHSEHRPGNSLKMCVQIHACCFVHSFAVLYFYHRSIHHHYQSILW